ncbi:MAG: DNA polymerase III subunit beta [Alphaproteobacteria bacterium]
MKLTIERSALLKSLAHAQSVVERRNTIPILANVMLQVDKGRLSLAATDMDIGIIETLEVEGGVSGATTAPAHTLYEIARKLPDGAQVQVDSTGENGQIKLRSGRSTFTLSTLPTEDFPVIAGGDLPYRFRIAAKELRGLIDRTRFAISTEETRYYLNGVYLHPAETDGVPLLRAVATDGHRLARCEIPLPDGAAGMPGVIVPRKAVAEIRKLLEEEAGEVEVALSESKIRFVVGDLVLISKLIDGTFPDYERVIPTGNDKQLDIDCKAFREAVDRVSTISSEKSRAVKLSLRDGSLTLSATSADNGVATEELEVRYDGPPMDIGFNSRYLLDIAGQIDGDTIELLLADSTAPTVLRDLADGSALYVLMPMRV